MERTFDGMIQTLGDLHVINASAKVVTLPEYPAILWVGCVLRHRLMELQAGWLVLQDAMQKLLLQLHGDYAVASTFHRRRLHV